MLVAALLCSTLAACGADDSGAGGQVADASSSPSTASAAPALVSPASITITSATTSTGTTTPVTTTPVTTSGSVQVAVPVTDALEPSGAADQPIAVARATTGIMTTLRVAPYTGQEPPNPTDVSSFRVPCGYSHMAFDDPIVFPGKSGASHLHVFFGNTSTDALTTTESLLAANSSTCAGGTANLSSYWQPALIDTVTGRAVEPKDYLVYYKKGHNGHTGEEIKSPPNGLRMIAGRSATATSPGTGPAGVIARFACNDGAWQDTIPDCPAGGLLKTSLDFPNCWDGVNLDSPDHRSHIRYARAFPDRRCPASHPVPVPTITMNVSFPIEAGASATRYRLSSDKYDPNQPGGYSFHGDAWVAWNEDIKATWMKNCINANMDCHAFLLGDGRRLY